ncbi:Isoamyl acetate-hydrolyzing esterase-like protein [Lachnellula occidentalis]|uniref:Isoamyl acetate-hydrolyzing esterase-like protein n=1 Tax=Lachnellula occidentalis TaxID=215460 RepID=A0A8H8S588_9HELO|nr:Isoamyl acetate-hydrolyzing esterase-like protein [Lachnellula occidentalis]
MADKKYPQFLLIGDSIIQFTSFTNDGFSFGAGLSEHVQRRLDVINRGLSGYNTNQAKVILDRLVPSPSSAKVDYLLLLFGSNDACLPNCPTKQHVPLDQYRKNMHAILNHESVKAHNPTILLVTPPPLNEVHLEAEDLKRGHPALTRRQSYTEQYVKAVREIAEEYKDQGVILIDLWAALMKEGARLTPGFVEEGGLLGSKDKGDSEGLRKLVVDGLHLTGAGYKVFLDEVLPVVGKDWAGEPMDDPSWIFPTVTSHLQLQIEQTDHLSFYFSTGHFYIPICHPELSIYLPGLQLSRATTLFQPLFHDLLILLRSNLPRSPNPTDNHHRAITQETHCNLLGVAHARSDRRSQVDAVVEVEFEEHSPATITLDLSFICIGPGDRVVGLEQDLLFQGTNKSPGMDSQFTPSREELYHVQMDVKHVQAVQINHADRLLRLEKRQADDAALKSVWGTGSPFPGILSGTPQQGPIQNPSTDVFDDFDDEQGQNMLGSLRLEADEEPVRRGASRANSVRFDISAIQGSNWAQSSSNSGEFGPVRPSSAFGSHPMMERSLSHKSDGRHSSAGHSVHSMHSVPSGRTSSLGLDTNFIIGDQDDDSPLDIPDPPPGLFILGPVPSIIRCWLTTNFSHSALLYADICTGSQRSVLDFSLVKELGLLDQIQKDPTGRHTIRLPIYLPEAIITHPSSSSHSPAPQLPTLTVDFEIVGLAQRNYSDRKNHIRVFVGSDTLRSHNADILFSQNLMTLYGDDRNKLSVPFVRPEDEATFKNLCTANILPERNELKATAASFTPTESKPKVEVAHDTPSALSNKIQPMDPSQRDPLSASTVEPRSPFTPISTSESNAPDQASSVKAENHPSNLSDSEKSHRTESAATEPDPRYSSDSNRRESAPGIWGSWRQGSNNVAENSKEAETTSGYQRATRGGRSMKVLKPSSKTISSATAPTRSISRTGTPYEPPAQGEIRRERQVEKVPLRWESKRIGLENIPKVPRSENPVGGASAFAWMNPASSKKTSTTAE